MEKGGTWIKGILGIPLDGGALLKRVVYHEDLKGVKGGYSAEKCSHTKARPPSLHYGAT